MDPIKREKMDPVDNGGANVNEFSTEFGKLSVSGICSGVPDGI